ncbi:hypothetical protein [Streptomyces sp. NPDC000410]|uniref:hypothetical protein n=1 Tax=Streptomyces sp. NPDC000410 TaxID=3154254 RepID=UPI003317140E
MAVFTGAFAVSFFAYALLADPRGQWWRYRARHFENPEAHEPSAASIKWWRGALMGVAAILAWQTVNLLRLAAAS